MPIHILIYCVRTAQCSNCKHLVMMSNFSFSHLIILSLLLVFQSHGTFAAPRYCFVNAIYSFGDSIADTGNLLREGLVGFFATIGNYPYGETYKKPTGRCSDGLLMIDFFGTDTGGSIQVPTAYCGICGFRPSHGIVSTMNVIPMTPSFDTVGDDLEEVKARPK